MGGASEVRALIHRFSLCTVLFRTHSLHCRLGLEKLNTTVAYYLLYYGWALVSVSVPLVSKKPLKTQTAANIKFPGYLEYTIN